MSRVAKKLITLPQGVELNSKDGTISVTGAKGTLTVAHPAGVTLAVEGRSVAVGVVSEASWAMAGTLRALLANTIAGVSTGYQRKLELVGVGYRAAMAGKDLNLTLGFSHPILFKVPAGVTVETPTQTEVVIKGSDKQSVGQVAAKIRAFRPPEPYKGKGVRYSGEKITIKEAKKA
jgi:large subunit ribosomal protein L6